MGDQRGCAEASLAHRNHDRCPLITARGGREFGYKVNKVGPSAQNCVGDCQEAFVGFEVRPGQGNPMNQRFGVSLA